MPDTRSTTEAIATITQDVAELSQRQAQFMEMMEQMRAEMRANADKMRSEFRELKLQRIRAEKQPAQYPPNPSTLSSPPFTPCASLEETHTMSSPPLLLPPSEHHEIVSSSTEHNLNFKDEMKIVSAVDTEDSDDIDSEVDKYSDSVLAKPTGFGNLHKEIFSIDSSSSLVLQKHESKDENVESGVGTLVRALNDSLNVCPPSVRQNVCEILRFLLPPAKPPDSTLMCVSTVESTCLGVTSDYKYSDQGYLNLKNVMGLMCVPYPCVFNHLSKIYMMPESSQKGELRFYRALKLPLEWKLEKGTLDKPLVDGNISFHGGMYWLLGSDHRGYGVRKNGELDIYYGSSPLGPWRPHQKNPIYNVDKSLVARNGGRPFIFNGDPHRVGQDCGETYGKRIRVFKVEVLNTNEFVAVEVPLGMEEPNKGRKAWNGARYHHLDAPQLRSGIWIAVMDGDWVPSGDSSRRSVVGVKYITLVTGLVALSSVLLGVVQFTIPSYRCPPNRGKRSNPPMSWERPPSLYLKFRLILTRLSRGFMLLRGIIKLNTCKGKIMVFLLFVSVAVCLGINYLYGGNGAKESYPVNGLHSQFTLLTMTYYASMSRLWNLKMYVKHFSTKRQSEFEVVVLMPLSAPFDLIDIKKKPKSINFVIWQQNMLLKVIRKYLAKKNGYEGLNMVDVIDKYVVGLLKELFVVSPRESVRKYWIGGKANHASHMVVFAQVNMIGEAKEMRLSETVLLLDFILGDLYTFGNKSRTMLQLGLTTNIVDVGEEFDNALIVDERLHDEVTDSVCLPCFATNIFMFSIPRPPEIASFWLLLSFWFSSPRPPEVADLEDKIDFKERGMLRNGIIRDIRGAFIF